MKISKICLLLTVFLSVTVTAFSQTADEIIAKYIDAIGGKAKLATLTSVRLESTMSSPGGDAASITTIVNGKGYRSESDFGGQKLIQVYTDKSGWALNPFTGATDPTPMPDAQFKGGQDQIYIVPLLDYAARGDKAELAGTEKVGNVEAQKVKVTNHNNIVATYYFDPTTHYLVQSVSTTDFGGQPMDMKVNYSDYKKNDFGYVMPTTIDIDFGGQFQLTSKVGKAEFNPAVDATVFDMKKP